MQDIERNMEDLFRKAAGRYPLKTSTDDWDKIAPLLAGSPIPAGTENKKVRIKKHLLLLTSYIVLLSGATILVTQTFKNNYVSAERSAKVWSSADVIKKENNIGLPLMTYLKSKIPSQWQHGTAKRKKVISGDARGYKKNDKVLNTTSAIAGNMLNYTAAAEIQSGTYDTMAQATAVKIDLPPARGTAVASSRAVNYPAKKTGGLYWGVVTGISFNQVKSQGLKKPGYDFGVLLGYTVSKKMSVEAGLIYEKKFYFTSGEYFNMTKAGASMPQGMKIISLEGSCSIFEVPLRLKYNLFNKPNKRFYLSAGASAYVITNEYNKYNTVINGTQQNIAGNYTKASPYVAAVFDAGFGYERKISSTAQIRIEPYIQIPLKGIGIGSLQVMTTGLHIGYTRVKR